MEDNINLERLAEAELLLEAKRGLARSNVYGPTGWKRCPLPGANKQFLKNTILNAVSSNKLKEHHFGVKHSRDYHSHRTEHKMKQRSDSLKEPRNVKEREKCNRTEKMLDVKLERKQSGSKSQHMNGYLLPERKASNVKQGGEVFYAQ